MTTTISYEPFERLIANLRSDGLIREADLLHHMIYKVAWTTGSELVGELGQKIKVIKGSPKLSDNSKEIIKEAMSVVKQVWPDFPE